MLMEEGSEEDLESYRGLEGDLVGDFRKLPIIDRIPLIRDVSIFKVFSVFVSRFERGFGGFLN